jgi:tetratricopeptide (TPR) repeat protein
LKEFNSKINFTSSYRENSPLFLRSAQNLLLNNDPHNAIIVLKNGLQKFPDHPVAHILLGKAFLRNHNYELAESNFKIAAELINSEKTYEYYANEIKKENRLTADRKNSSQNKDTVQSVREELGTENRSEQSTDTKAIEDRLEQLAEAISSARIQRVNDNDIQKSDVLHNIPEGGKIISETLAKIYLAQGEHDEAISVYERLIKKNPLKENYYLEKIREIRSL